jgi:hypothetical protein
MSSGRAQIMKVEIPVIDKAKAFDEGWVAHHNGQHPKLNPYRDADNGTAWDGGFQARMAATRAGVV